ncbi:hypothetical protein DINM_007218 [Dirofilaria immitis]|nr:hypothetical protein [Dirofilaria immitis]
MGTVLFCRRSGNFYSHAYFHIVLHLIIADLMAFLPQLIVVVPEILRNKNSSYANQTLWVNKAFSTFANVPMFAVLHFSFLLAINRFVVFILPKYNVFFESAKLYSLIILVWLSVLVITITDYHYCTRKFLASNFSWEGSCTKSKGEENSWWRIRYTWALFLPSGMFVIYVAIFCSIRRKHRFAENINRSQKNTNMPTRHETTARKTYGYEWSILIQAAWNCGMMEIGIIAFNYLPLFLVQIFGERIYVPSKIFVNSYAAGSCAVLPTVYFIYGEEARSIVKQYLCHLFHLVAANSKIKSSLLVSGHVQYNSNS